MLDAIAPPAEECLTRDDIARRQSRRLGELIRAVHGRNRFYTRKLDAAGVDVFSLRFPDDVEQLPFATKRELVADQDAAPPWGTAMTEPTNSSSTSFRLSRLTASKR